MSRPKIVAAVLALAVVSAGFALREVDTDHPPHREPPKAEALAPLSLAAVGGESVEAAGGWIAAFDEAAWIEGVNRAAWIRGVEAAAEAERLAAEARARDLRRSVPRASTGTGGASCEALAAEFGLPVWILQRESTCGVNNWNGSGCGGRGCIGPTQIDVGHGWEVSPWGGPGACRDLDLNTTAGQVECTRRLSGGGSNLRPWGG